MANVDRHLGTIQDVVRAANRLKLPVLVGYLLAGVLVGPFTPGYVADQELAPQLAEIGVILLMFGVGLHFSLRDLMSVKNIAIPGAVAQIAVATGDTQRFSLLDTQYKAAPEVTRKRLYLETLQGVLANNTKIIDTGNGKNLIYLPLDKLKSGLDATTAAAAASVADDTKKTGKEANQ